MKHNRKKREHNLKSSLPSPQIHEGMKIENASLKDLVTALRKNQKTYIMGYWVGGGGYNIILLQHRRGTNTLLSFLKGRRTIRRQMHSH
jgi:hypothetical protein